MLMVSISIEDNSVRLVIGDKKEFFYVKEDILCASSAYFDRALKGPWKEAQSRCFELPNESTSAFRRYINWLHSGSVTVLSDNNGSECFQLVEAYILADAFLDVNYENAVIKAIVKTTCPGPAEIALDFPRCPVVSLAYEHTMPRSPLRRILVDIWTWHGKQAIPQLKRHLPTGFVCDLTEGFWG